MVCSLPASHSILFRFAQKNSFCSLNVIFYFMIIEPNVYFSLFMYFCHKKTKDQKRFQKVYEKFSPNT